MLLIFILLSSCSEGDFINYNLTEPETKLCLSGYICPDSTYIVLSLSQSYSDFIAGNGRPETISGSDASVVLFEDNTPFDTLISQSRQVGFFTENYYASRKNTIPGKTYRISARYKQFDAISAQTDIPIPTQVNFHSIEIQYFNEYYYPMLRLIKVSLFINDNSDFQNYYIVHKSKYYGNQHYYQMLRLLDNSMFENYNNSPNETLGSFIFFSDKLVNGSTFSVQYSHLERDNEQPLSGPVTFSLYSISEDYYRYELSRQIKINSQYDVNSNPVTIYSNVDGGYGIFMGFSESKYTVEFDGSI